MHIHDILKMTEDEEIRKLTFPSAVITWSGPYTFTEVAGKSGGGLYVTATTTGKPLYVGQTSSYRSRFRSRVHVLRIAGCGLHSRGVYIGKIVKPSGRSVNKKLRLDLESVLIRSYLNRAVPISLVNKSSIRKFMMGPESAVITNKGTLPPKMKRWITVKGNTLFELNVINDKRDMYESEYERDAGFENLNAFSSEHGEIRRIRRPRRRKKLKPRKLSTRLRPLSIKRRYPRIKRRPHRRKNIFRRHVRLLPSSETYVNSPVGTEQIRWVQSSLNQTLGTRLRINGIMGRATREALRDFQKRDGLIVDGIVGPETEQALIAARSGLAASSTAGARPEQEQFLGYLTRRNRRLLRRRPQRDRGRVTSSSISQPHASIDRKSREYIKWVQQSLNTLQGSRLSVDGLLGSMTRSAVRSFQSQNGLFVDGIVGPITEAALLAAGANKPGVLPPSSYVPETTPSKKPSKEDSKLVEVEPGKYVDRQIAPNVIGLLKAARQSGLTLSINSAYRSPDEQIGLRRRFCGTTDYDIYEKDPRECSPITARPGTSNHEKGLAVDLAWNSVGPKKQWSDPEAIWLRRYAKVNFGLDNKISSEPWHWSINGR